MIEDHYFMREIGFETPMLFKHYLNARMREIMPKYNAMYATIPTYDPNMTTFSDTTTDEKTGTIGKEIIKGSQRDIRYDFDTPMNTDSINMESPNHMSGAERSDYGGRTDSDTDTFNTKDTITRSGTNQSVFQTIEQYRAFEFNIDKMIIEELEDLFMMIF